MVAVTEIHRHQVDVVLQDRPHQVVGQELEAGELQLRELVVMRGSDDLKCLLGQSLVVGQVQAPAD